MAAEGRMAETYAALGEVDRALRARYTPALEAGAARLAVALHDFSVLMAVLAWEPEPTTPWHFGLRGPYTSLSVYGGWLSGAAERALLVETSPGEYRATERGRRIGNDLIAVARRAMEPTVDAPLDDAERFAHLLRDLGQACLTAPPPPDTWSVQLSHFHYPGDGAPVMGRIDQWVTDLRAFRDDAHLAAWRSFGLSGPALEALTLLWRGEAASPDSLSEKLARRGHPREVYAAALAELRARGWLAGADDAPRLTGAGGKAREDIERRTDDLFFRPWSALTAEAHSELLSLARAIARALAGAD